MKRWLEEKIFHNGDAFFEDLIEGFKSARHTIDFETYIFENDELGHRIVQALKDAARREVAVRVLVDGIGSPFWRLHFAKELSAAGVKARVYHPAPWAIFSFPLRFKRVFRLFMRLNRRNHRKVCIVDNHRAWLGSMNVSAVHLEEFSGDQAWRDTGLRVVGKDINDLEYAFNIAWARAWYLHPFKGRFRPRRRAQKQSKLVRLNDTLSARQQYTQGLMDRMDRARIRIWITNAYFVPPRLLVRALLNAGDRGLDIRLLLPRHPDVKIIKWAASAFYAMLLRNGVRIFEYEARVLHAKTMLIDEWATVGSSNLDTRSFRHDYEVVAVLTLPESINSLAEQFRTDLEQSREISLKRWSRRSGWRRLIERMVLFLRYWI